jgi:hypothetical protein
VNDQIACVLVDEDGASSSPGGPCSCTVVQLVRAWTTIGVASNRNLCPLRL